MNNYQNLFKKVLVVLIFFSSATILSAQIPINDELDFLTMDPDSSYILMQDIIVNQMYPQPFRCNFDGNGFKITVNIISNDPNVGLFSQFDGAIINLIIDGSVTGGLNSQNVGGFVGLSTINCNIANCTNLSNVSGFHTVGGLIGRISNTVEMNLNINNGTITGGENIGGLIGAVNVDGGNLHFCKNAGTIIGIGESQSCMAGIIAYANCHHLLIHGAINIGNIMSSNSNYAGGIAGRFTPGSADMHINEGFNAGIVDGARIAVGGIIGYTSAPYSTIANGINVNWVSKGTATYYGSIVGYHIDFPVDPVISYCYYDNQMSILGGVNGIDVVGSAEGRPTDSMIGNNIPWTNNNNRYPQLYPVLSVILPQHPIVLLAIAPIYFQNNERVDNVMTNFYVSNWLSSPPTTFTPISEQYQWSSFSGGRVISIPLTPLNNATINSNGQDTLEVKLLTDPIYKKSVPVNVP